MENLTLEEPPPQGGAQMPLLGPGLPPQQNQQLPPQMFTTAAQLLDMTDSKGVFTFVRLNNCDWEGTQIGYFQHHRQVLHTARLMPDHR